MLAQLIDWWKQKRVDQWSSGKTLVVTVVLVVQIMNTSSSSPMLSNSPPVESDQSMVSKPLMVMEASRSHIRSPPFAMASSGEPTCKSPLLFEPSSTTRKLMRSESTYGEDLFEDKIPSKLNQRHVLRQQWFRKNNSHMSRLRRSTSTASNSSSSSSGISLKGLVSI